MFCRGVFRTQSNIYDEGFLRKQLMAKNSIVDVRLSYKYASALLFCRVATLKDFTEFPESPVVGSFFSKGLFLRIQLVIFFVAAVIL